MICSNCKHRDDCINAFNVYDSVGNDDHTINCQLYQTILYNANPEREHEIVSASGGGIKCKKCNGWFCY